MIKRFCAHDRCNALVTPPEKYCAKHKPKVVHGTDHHNPFYSTARWQKFRNWYFAQNPLCEHCGIPGKVVDHIRELKDGGAELDESNVQTLCTRCHAKKTQREKRKRKQGPVVYSY